MKLSGLRLDQAPPLSVPASFFLTAPLAAVAAGALLVWHGGAALTSPWLPATVALAHLGTLGFLAMVMMGALYQMLPVVAATPVPAAGLARAVHALLAVGVAGLVWGMAAGPGASPQWRTSAAVATLAAALALFLGPVVVALARAPARGETVAGMRLAVASLLTVALLGLWMGWGYATGHVAAPRALWLQVHLTVGLVGWVSGLITAVSWQVVPMFYLADAVAPSARRAVLAALALGLGATLLALALGGDARIAGAAALPAALAVWWAQPALLLKSLLLRRRSRAEVSLRAWVAGLCVAFALPPLGAAAVLLEGSAAPLLFGWLAIWGYAGLIVHGMLTRIVPFLVWFHRFSALAGLAEIPPMNRLLPEGLARAGLGLHLASLALGVAAIASGSDALARLTGAALVGTGAALLLVLGSTLRQRPR